MERHLWPGPDSSRPCGRYELDQGDVLAYKENVLAGQGAEPLCIRTGIGVDLRGNWLGALQASGFDPARPAAWLVEGLLPYLHPKAQLDLLTRLSSLAAPGSTLVFDNVVGDPRADHRLRRLSERSGIDMESLMAGGEADNLSALLGEHGWKADEQSTTTLAQRYSRDLSDPFRPNESSGSTEPPWLDTTFVSATLPT